MTHADELLGRDIERRQLGLMLGRARNARGGAVLIVGDPGIGKTALLHATTVDPRGMRVMRVAGCEAESTIPFAAVQRLTGALADRLDGVPPRQRQAIAVAAGAADGPPPDRFLVGLGVMSLLTDVAAGTPVVCVVDDAHLLDAESLDALAFVARRIEAESIAMLFAGRGTDELASRLVGVPELAIEGLPTDSAVALLRRSVRTPIDPAVAVQIAQAVNGNPLALVDLANELSAGQLARLGLGERPIPVGHRLEAHYLRQVRHVGGDVESWLLVAAADSTGDIDLITATVDALGISDGAADAAEAAGLIELADTVRFRHPLVRSAVYGGATGGDRRRVHRALAATADRLGLVELEAWHAAEATLGTDPIVADRLEHAADLAARRGGLASRASVLSRAAGLTPPGPAKAARLIGAAEAALAVGAAATAAGLLDAIADPDDLDPVLRARIVVARYAVALFLGDAETLRSGTALLIQAADLFHGHDAEAEQRTLLKAFESCVMADRSMRGVTLRELGDRLTAGAALRGGPISIILRALGAMIQLPYHQAHPPVRRALDEIGTLSESDMMTLGTAITALTTYLCDVSERDAALQRAAAAAQDAGALLVLDTIWWIMSLAQLTGGSVRRASEFFGRVRELRRAMGYDAEQVANAALMAWTGAPREVVRQVAQGASAAGFGGVAASATGALGIRDLAERHYRDAFQELRPLIDEPFLQVTPTQWPDFVEVAVRSGHRDLAIAATEQVRDRAVVCRTAWYRGLSHRCDALVAADDDAEVHYQASVRELQNTESVVDLGRTRLLYGEWLRRMKRRRAAREQLRLSRELFERGGATIFLDRVRAEIEATGSSMDGATDPQPHGLTAQELAVARLAAAGRTNAEIADTIFISRNTVDYHLRKVFARLGITSRRQLAERLQQQ